ncbi:hypothetical protein ACNITB_26870, partial [Escherichia coli]
MWIVFCLVFVDLNRRERFLGGWVVVGVVVVVVGVGLGGWRGGWFAGFFAGLGFFSGCSLVAAVWVEFAFTMNERPFV